tara:strand:- start:1351 stop:1485 length:135 start_codon:yes stop_codon:yes gene_type:complete
MREKIEAVLANVLKELEQLMGRPEISEELKPISVPIDDKKAKLR